MSWGNRHAVVRTSDHPQMTATHLYPCVHKPPRLLVLPSAPRRLPYARPVMFMPSLSSLAALVNGRRFSANVRVDVSARRASASLSQVSSR